MEYDKEINYLLDTSIILDNVENIPFIYKHNKVNIFVNDIVLHELNKKKEQNGEIGFCARDFFRKINSDDLSKVNSAFHIKPINKDFITIIIFRHKNLNIPIFVIQRPKYKTPHKDYGLNDLKIIEIAKDYNITLLTNDIALKVQAASLGICVDSLNKDIVENPDELNYIHKLTLHKNIINESLESQNDFKNMSNWSILDIDEQDNTDDSLYLTGKKYFGIKLNNKFEELKLDEIIEDFNPYVKPINLEQKLFFCLLTHPQNKITVASGSTGSGKTLIALQAGICLFKKNIIDGIVYLRNTVTANDKEAELGFRKGDQLQKLQYFMYPLYSAVNFTISQMQKESLAKRIEYRGDVNSPKEEEATAYFLRKHNISMIDIAHARGTTIYKKFVIFDELQNCSNSILKLIGTRLGDDSKIVMLGDYMQIDHPYLTKSRNALVYALKKAKEDGFISAIKLHHIIRSEVAKWFEDNI